MAIEGRRGRVAGSAGFTARGRLRAALAALRGAFASFVLREWLARQFEREAEARSFFYLLPISMMVGIAVVYGGGFRPPIAAASGLAAAAAGVALARQGWTRMTACAVVFAVLGAALAVAEIRRTDTVIFSGDATVRVGGRVLWRDYDERGRFRYLVAIDHTERPALSRPPSRAEILVSSRHDPLAIGGRYLGLVRLRPPSGPALPGSYDFSFGAFFRGLGAYGYALGPPDAPVDGDVPSLSLGERLTALRLVISDRIREVIGGGEGAVASAIITGERSGIPDDVEEWLRVTGLSHVLSISGVHMALAAGFAMVLVRGLCAALPVIALHLPSKKVGAWGALLVSAAYLALSGADVAATRSFIMIAIMLTAVIFDRSALTLRNVAIAALIVLAVMPHAMFTASFQMSFAATAAIVAVYGPLSRGLSGGGDRRRRGLIHKIAIGLAGIAVSSTVAGIATAPYAAFHFQRTASFGLLANMATLPLFSVWIMPLALLAMLAMPFGLDAPLLWLLGRGLALVFAIAKTLAAYMPDNPTGLLTIEGLVILTIALLVACFFVSALRYLSVPIAALGLLLVIDRSEMPELLVFEDGREVALIDAAGRVSSVKDRPNRFVFGQWQRAYPVTTIADRSAFDCETITDDLGTQSRYGAKDRPLPQAEPEARKPRRYRFCRAATRSGLRVVWTDDYRSLGRACDEGDIAIVARAVRVTECRSSAMLLTLRTLRATGSTTIRRGENGRPISGNAFGSAMNEWNLHRLEPWPERWRKDAVAASPSASRTDAVPPDADP